MPSSLDAAKRNQGFDLFTKEKRLKLPSPNLPGYASGCTQATGLSSLDAAKRNQGFDLFTEAKILTILQP